MGAVSRFVPRRAQYAVRRARLAALYYPLQLRNDFRRRFWDFASTAKTSRELRAGCLYWGAADAPVPATLENVSTEGEAGYAFRLQGKALIEPKYGYVVRDHFQMMDHSLTNARVTRMKGYSNLLGTPSPVRIALNRYVVKKTMHLPRCVSLMNAWPENYFHFHNDFLPKLAILDELFPGEDLPLVVPDRLYDQKFFREFAALPGNQRNFVAPRGRYIATAGRDVHF